MAHFAIPSHILVGKDALPSAVPYLKTYGNRVFIVTGKHVGKSPMMEQLKKHSKRQRLLIMCLMELRENRLTK